jgi:predicted dienelactone hydrolase
MRLTEWMLAALVVAGIATLSVPLPMRIAGSRAGAAVARLYALVAVLLFAVHAWTEGAHWQMLPIYTAILVLAWQLARQPAHKPARKLDQRSARAASLTAMGLWAAGLALCWVLPMFRLPPPTGPYAVGTRTLHLWEPQPDGSARELVAQLWYPAEPTGPLARYARPAELKPLFSYEGEIRTNAHQDAPLARNGGAFPLLLFGHMWGGRRTQDTFLAEELASHGYVVAAVDHPGNSARVQLSDGRVVHGSMADALSNPRTAEEYQATWNGELAVWTQDNEFVLNALADAHQSPGGWLHRRLDLNRVGAFGHSFGGAASLRLLGLKPSGEAPPVRAAVNLDGYTFTGLASRTTQPVLLLYEAKNAQDVPQHVPQHVAHQVAQQVDKDPGRPVTGDSAGDSVDDQLTRADRAAIDASLERAPGLIGYVLGTQHLDFTDQTLVSPLERLTYTGPLPGERMRTITRALVLAFFDRTLKGTGTMPAFPEVRWVRGTQPAAGGPASAANGR